MLLWMLMWAAIVLATPVAAIGRLMGVRFLSINCKRIGHLAVEPDCFIKERILGRYREIMPFVCAPENQVCNHALLNCWKPYLIWITDPWLCAILKPFEWHPLLAFDVSSYAIVPKEGCGFVSIAQHWKGREPVIVLSEHIEEAGKQALLKMGLPDGAWFVCVHNREGGYSPDDED